MFKIAIYNKTNPHLPILKLEYMMKHAEKIYLTNNDEIIMYHHYVHIICYFLSGYLSLKVYKTVVPYKARFENPRKNIPIHPPTYIHREVYAKNDNEEINTFKMKHL